MEPPKSVQQKEQIAPSRAIYSAEKATKSTALNGTVKKCRFNQFLSNVCTLHSQSCEVKKKHTFTEVLTDKVFVRQYQTALPLVTLYWRSQMNVEIVDIIFQKCNVLETLILNANWPGSIISGPLKVEIRWYFGRLCFDRRLRPNNG